MPAFDANGLFAGLSKDDKARAVLAHLRIDAEITRAELMAATGMTASQVHAGIRHVREAMPHCVVTTRRGPTSTYRLAEDAPEVRDYARRRMRLWYTQISVIAAEMDTAQRLLPKGEMRTVQAVAEALTALMRMLEVDVAIHEEFEAQQRKIDREQAQLKRKRSKVLAVK